jgi:magnesium-protoporphyrin O-methyltransferase
MSYADTRDRLEHYFDRTASKTWERLTSDAPVSRIRQTVREGRDAMRAALLARLPADMRGLRVLDAGCGTGAATAAMAERGAEVVAVDISASLIEVARTRVPVTDLRRVTFHAGDMLDPGLGRFDHVLAMDSLIHYRAGDIAQMLAQLAARTKASVVFTVAPRTPALTAMWWAGKLFPRSDRSPAIVPHAEADIAGALRAAGVTWRLRPGDRVARGFYISQAMELVP